ncbi:hypothetical protein GGQ54_000407 [Naumannella cuiyingiana]|uniref:GerMN domain-containing protein n=1 Tax=Naumannella cuiyingiana TaxID=1347891 RepID=A0A7Z0IJX0_9ACTN|nr:LpqB family beta-propeller domain-containing protein [Naumannella cuiyingiana]NYI69847.1 hypothetical protein [Naumannella cuiyingiana]
MSGRWATRRRAPRLLAALAAALALLVTGCASMPTSGPVEFGGRGGQVADAEVDIAPEPPRTGAEPRDIVDGFLQAMANYQPGYATAREYLTPQARQSWQPEAGIVVYADGSQVNATSDSAVLTAPVQARIDSDGAYVPGRLLDPEDPLGDLPDRLVRRSDSDPQVRIDFGLERDAAGQWRIGNPPPGRLIQAYLFQQFFTRASAYYLDGDLRMLVPDPVYVPRGSQSPLARLQILFRGPTRWLEPAVRTAIPAGTELSTQSAFVDAEGVVDVSLRGPGLAGLPDEQRGRMRDQIVATLAQVPAVTAVRLSLEGAPYPVPGAPDGLIGVGPRPGLDPIPAELGEQLFGSTGRQVVTVDDQQGAGALSPVAGPWGRDASGVQTLSPSLTGDRVAGITRDGTELWEAPVADGGEARRVLTGRRLLRPQYVGGGRDELWALDAADSTARVVTATGITDVPVDLSGGALRAFRISPDGTRIAAVAERDGRAELGLLRVRREAEPRIDGWRALPLSARAGRPAPDVAASDVAPIDVAWVSDEELMVLTAGEGANRPWRVASDASEATQLGAPDGWAAETITALPRHRTPRVVVLGPAGAWRYDDSASWSRLGDELTAVSFAG